MTTPEFEASPQLFEQVYMQLRGLARERMRGERKDHTLQATALVHEAFARLNSGGKEPWRDRAHYYAAAAEAMRRVLIEHARARGRDKRGGALKREPINVADLAIEADLEEIMSLDEAIRRLDELDAEVCRVLRLRFFAGLSIEETAATLDISPATVKRRWEFARAWLFHDLGGDGELMPREQSDP